MGVRYPDVRQIHTQRRKHHRKKRDAGGAHEPADHGEQGDKAGENKERKNLIKIPTLGAGRFTLIQVKLIYVAMIFICFLRPEGVLEIVPNPSWSASLFAFENNVSAQPNSQCL